MIRELTLALLLHAGSAPALDASSSVPTSDAQPADGAAPGGSSPEGSGESESTSSAPAQPEAPSGESERADSYRAPVDALAESMIGTASRSVRFDWRRSPVGIALVGSELLERNNFGSARVGVLARRAFGDLVAEAAFNYAMTWPTLSSELLSLTPYRQAGRPNRFEADVNVSYPLAEGVVTPLPSFVPPAEMVFLATGGLRYLVYPEGFNNMRLEDVALALASPQLSEAELENLEHSRLPGMQVDPGRFGMLAGFSLDLYFQPGVFVSPRALLNLPVFSLGGGTRLGFWWETSIAVGFAL